MYEGSVRTVVFYCTLSHLYARGLSLSAGTCLLLCISGARVLAMMSCSAKECRWVMSYHDDSAYKSWHVGGKQSKVVSCC